LISSLIILGDIAVINGIYDGLKQGINEVISGELTVYNSKDEQVNILESQLTEQTAFLWSGQDKQHLLQIVPDIHINQRIRLGSLISYIDETSYLYIHALEGDHLERINRKLTFRQGGFPQNEKDIIISESMADNLYCQVGDTVLLVANNIHDYMSDAIGVISGIFEEKGIAIFLGYNGFMLYEYGKEIAGVQEGECLELIINTSNSDDFTKEDINAITTYYQQKNPELQIAEWDQTVPLMYKIVQIWKGGGILTQVIFTLFSLIILITLTSLIIHSRRKEFGTLLAIGFSWNKIRILVSLEYILITLFTVICAYVILLIIISQLPFTGIHIASEYMQAALMTEYLYPFMQIQDVGYVLFLFTATSLVSVLISIRKLKKVKIHSLIND